MKQKKQKKNKYNFNWFYDVVILFQAGGFSSLKSTEKK